MAGAIIRSQTSTQKNKGSVRNDNIIAHFMGGKVLKEEHYEMPHGSHQDVVISNWQIPKGTTSDNRSSASIGIFHYSNDWNSLIPVIEQIETLEIDDEVFRFSFRKNVCTIEAQCVFLQPSTIWHVHLEATGKNKIEATNTAIVEFIKWLHNEKNKK